MWEAERVAAGIGAEHDGIVVSAALRAAGVDRYAEARLRRRGVLVELHQHVMKLRDHPWTWRTTCRAALECAGPTAALGLRTAARSHGFYRYQAATVVEVVVLRGGSQRTLAGTRLVRTRALPAGHVVDVEGLRTTSIARTFFDLCGDPDHGLPVAHPYHERQMARVYNDALARRGLRFVHEVAVLTTMAQRGRAGTVLVRQLLDAYGPSYEPTRSELESAFVELVDEHGLPTPEKQVTMSDEEGFIGVVDFAWPDARVVVEIDSRWHDGPLETADDRERDRRLARLGYTVRRYRYGHVVMAPHAVAAELGLLLIGLPLATEPNS